MPIRPTLPLLILVSGVAMLAGCASTTNTAPVESRQPAPSRPAPAPQPVPVPPPASAAAADPAKPPPPGIENAGKPGYYTVKPGDTLIRIGLDQGQNWRDIVRWNAIENPNLIEVGQVLRVVPPQADASVVTAQRVAQPKVETRPLDGKPAAPAAAASGGAPATTPATTAPAASTAPSTAGATAAPAASAAPAPAPAPATPPDDEPAWVWPSTGSVVAPFDDARQKGLVFGGKAGDPVLAAADGRVVYAGSALRGYGNLVIIKHNNTYLTAYAHNQALLVKEDQAVRRGQKIAEMGSTEADRVQLHFEIRRQGKPVDPARLLPAR